MNKNEFLNFITELVMGDDDYEINAKFREYGNRRDEIAEMIFNDSILLNIRARIARFLFECEGRNETIFNLIKGHQSSLVRLGMVIGLGNQGSIEGVKEFLNDSNEKVRREAEDIVQDSAMEDSFGPIY